MPRRAISLTAVALLLSLSVGCRSQNLGRDDLRERYLAELIDAGITGDLAECVVAAFIDPMTDDELRAFNTEGDSLTDDEQARIGVLAAQCAAGNA